MNLIITYPGGCAGAGRGWSSSFGFLGSLGSIPFGLQQLQQIASGFEEQQKGNDSNIFILLSAQFIFVLPVLQSVILTLFDIFNQQWALVIVKMEVYNFITMKFLLYKFPISTYIDNSSPIFCNKSITIV